MGAAHIWQPLFFGADQSKVAVIMHEHGGTLSSPLSKAAMRQIWRFAAISLVPGIVLPLILLGRLAIDVYVRGNCDPKFGCLGSIFLAIWVGGSMFICSFFGHLTASLIFHKILRLLSVPRLLGVLVVLSLGQGAVLIAIGLLPKDSITSMMVEWAAMSGGIALGVLYLAHCWPPYSSRIRKAAPLD